MDGNGYTNTTNTTTGSNQWTTVTNVRIIIPPDDGLAGARAVLDVPPGSPPDVLRKAYRAKLKETHPDHGGDADAVRRVIDAYRKLCPDAVAA